MATYKFEKIIFNITSNINFTDVYKIFNFLKIDEFSNVTINLRLIMSLQNYSF